MPAQFLSAGHQLCHLDVDHANLFDVVWVVVVFELDFDGKHVVEVALLAILGTFDPQLEGRVIPLGIAYHAINLDLP